MARLPVLMIPSRIAPSGGVEIVTEAAGAALGPLTAIGALQGTPTLGASGKPALLVVFDT